VQPGARGGADAERAAVVEEAGSKLALYNAAASPHHKPAWRIYVEALLQRLGRTRPARPGPAAERRAGHSEDTSLTSLTTIQNSFVGKTGTAEYPKPQAGGPAPHVPKSGGDIRMRGGASRRLTGVSEMNIKPAPEFLEACRRVLGGDDPATVLSAMINGDPRMDQVRAVHADLLLIEESKEPLRPKSL